MFRICWEGYLDILESVSCSGAVPLKFKDPVKPIIPRSSFELNLFDDIARRVSCGKCPGVVYFAKIYEKMHKESLRTSYGNNKRLLYRLRTVQDILLSINRPLYYIKILCFTE